jgi:phage terminase large subunit-like protein
MKMTTAKKRATMPEASKRKAKPGPKRTAAATMKARGSRRHRAREIKAEKAKVNGRQPFPRSPPRLKLPSDRALVQWKKLLQSLPKYDPYAGSAEKTYRFDPKRARPIVDFFETRLRHVKGPKAKQFFRLERWQQAALANLFGWVHRKTGFRRYREVFFFVPRKNGKTPMAAGIILYMLSEDGKYGAEIYGTACTYRQASLVFDWARGMVNLDPELNERCQTFKGTDKAIQIDDDEAGLSTYRVACSEALQAEGWNTLCGLIDEYQTQPNGELTDAMETSTAAQDESLLIKLATSDFERVDSMCNALQDRAHKIQDNPELDLQFLPVMYEAPKDADWHDRKVWERANPNLGVSVQWDYTERAHRKACESAADENTFKRRHLNIRTSTDVQLVTKERWDACNHGPVCLADLAGLECYSGLDLAASQDLIAWVLSFKAEDGVFPLVPIMWLPKETADERFRKARVPYPDWAAQGHIRLTEGGAADYAAIRRDINAIIDKHKLKIRDIATDRLFQGDQLCQELREQDGLPCTPHGQGHLDFAAPMKRFMELLGERKLSHGGHPVLAWHASNVMAKLDAAGNMKPDREKSTEKIDGFVASVMAVGRAVAAIAKRPSVYATRGVVRV